MVSWPLTTVCNALLIHAQMAFNPTINAVEKELKIYRQENADMLSPFEISDHPAGGIVPGAPDTPPPGLAPELKR
jgi:hypothetical protein